MVDSCPWRQEAGDDDLVVDGSTVQAGGRLRSSG